MQPQVQSQAQSQVQVQILSQTGQADENTLSRIKHCLSLCQVRTDIRAKLSLFREIETIHHNALLVDIKSAYTEMVLLHAKKSLKSFKNDILNVTDLHQVYERFL